MARRTVKTRRAGRGGSRKGATPPRSRRVKIVKVTSPLENHRHLDTYTMKIPRGMRDLSPREVVQPLYDRVKEKHGGGVGDFRKIHFWFTFSGVEYDFATGQRIGRATYGTFLTKSLHAAREDLVSRVKAIQEGEASGKKTIKGVRSGGSAFRNGPDVITAHVASKDGRKSWHGKHTSSTKKVSTSSTKRGSKRRVRGSGSSAGRARTRS